MNMNKNCQLFKHQAFVTGVVVCIVVISFIGGSYAWFHSQSMNDEYNAFQENDIELSYVDGDNGYGEILSLMNQVPISDQDGLKLEPYRFSVTNVGDEEKYFSLKIHLDQAIIEQEKCMNKILSTSYIKYQIDNQEPKILADLEQSDYEIYASPETLMPGSSEIHELRIWIDQASPEVVKNKHFHARVTIEDKDPAQRYDFYSIGEAVTLLDGSKYHVLETSQVTDSKVKLISDYHIDVTGKQDIDCVITETIEEQISPEDYVLYCSTMNYENAVSVLYEEYLN
ncbi:MAG: hypothetical protein PUB18_04655, partial [bacterium]|nr:hypothetical protein [bacterium]